MEKYLFYARFTEEDGYSIDFPNVEGAYTEGETLEEGLRMAEECLGLHLYGLKEYGEVIPESPSREELEKTLLSNQSIFEIVIDLDEIKEGIIKFKGDAINEHI